MNICVCLSTEERIKTVTHVTELSVIFFFEKVLVYGKG